MAASGPIHLIGTSIFVAGIFTRILAFIQDATYIMLYTVPIGACFLSTWLFNSYTIASMVSWAPGVEAWGETLDALKGKMNGLVETRNSNRSRSYGGSNRRSKVDDLTVAQ